MNYLYETPYVIAEVGCNHMGNLEVAKEMIEVASSFCKVNAVKFQKRCPSESLSKEAYDAPHTEPHNAYGDTYGKHREYLEFNIEQHKQLKNWCEIAGVTYSASVWDMTSAKEIISLSPEFLKIPSACNTHDEMLEWICAHYGGEIHVSLGMTTRSEEEDLIDLFVRNKRNKDLVLFSCTSGYPVSFSDICLMEISRLRHSYGSIVKKIGFSGHHLGIAADIAAYTLGANIIERHYTLDRSWKGTDHAASLEPGMIRKLKRDLLVVQESLQYKNKEVLEIEEVQRKKLKVITNLYNEKDTSLGVQKSIVYK
jgi:N-acetylneuraminate synthase